MPNPPIHRGAVEDDREPLVTLSLTIGGIPLPTPGLLGLITDAKYPPSSAELAEARREVREREGVLCPRGLILFPAAPNGEALWEGGERGESDEAPECVLEGAVWNDPESLSESLSNTDTSGANWPTKLSTGGRVADGAGAGSGEDEMPRLSSRKREAIACAIFSGERKPIPPPRTLTSGAAAARLMGFGDASVGTVVDRKCEGLRGRESDELDEAAEEDDEGEGDEKAE